MASRAIPSTRGGTGSDWRAVLHRSVRRSAELIGAALLLAALVFVTLALVSYTQTDPSGSTASGSAVENWAGLAGAWTAERLLLVAGLPGALGVPLLWIMAMRLWDRGEPDQAAPVAVWWLCLLMALAIALIDGALGLVWPGAALPAGNGGLIGLIAAMALRWCAHFAGEAQGAVVLGLALVFATAGVVLAGRVFVLAGWRINPLPLLWRRREPAAADDDTTPEPVAAPRAAVMPLPAAPAASSAPRRATEISDPNRPPAPAPLQKARQGDLFDTFELPPIELLDEIPVSTAPKIDKLALERNARLLENVLDDFNVKGEIMAVRTGPVVTMYELEPAPGIKASRVIGLSDDIARNMSAISARVSAIPGRTVMGIELPNVNRETVSFRELIGCERFVAAKGLLPIILGKDITGEPIIADLAAMPHLLVAGTTGSGKSVGLNCILLSLLFRLTPQQCRMILIDPKVLELKSYDEIPHLLSPVVTEPAKAVRALKWAVEEMERRYRQMSSISVRNLSGFNDKVRAAAARGNPLGRRIQVGFDPDTGEELYEEQQLDYQVLPQIVIIVDELADLMITVGKEIEVLIQRLSQKSRAAGIHLIMATQRPSVDVITGVIKANLPTRISFAVASRIDSRTILGEQGAEQLLGKGDMLYKPNSDPIKRVHGPFVADGEVERIAEHWRKQGAPEYVDSVTEEPVEGSFGFDDLDATASDSPEERKYRQVCQLVFESQKASASWVQRQMKVGYNNASKWIERMEADGYVGPPNHVGRREIYRDKDGNPL